MESKQATCKSCGPTLAQSKGPLNFGNYWVMLFGITLLSLATCGLFLPFGIAGFVLWKSKEDKERSVFRCNKCGAAV